MNHELLWTRDPYLEDSRAYCRCGWLAPADTNAAEQRSWFVTHLLELRGQGMVDSK